MDELYIDDGYTQGDFYVNSDVYIVWGQKIIYVPRRVGTLVQSVPNEIRQINITEFWLTLKDLEDDESGMPFLDTHNNNPPVNVGGVSLARVLEIINGYTITWEEGQYTVQIVGGNSNLADVTNRNQVSVSSANSAGLIEAPAGSATISEQDKLDIADRVWDEPSAEHVLAGTVGELLANIAAAGGGDAVGALTLEQFIALRD